MKNTIKRQTALWACGLASMVLLGSAGCDNPLDPTLCIPCGDFAPDCGGDMGCATCYSQDINLQTGEFSTRTEYENGSYAVMTMENGAAVTTYYLSTGAVCYSVSADQSGNVTYTIDGKAYTMIDEDTWTCPDGSTWERDPACPTGECTTDDCDNDGIVNDEDNCPGTYNPDQADADGDGVGNVCESTCPDITTLPACA